MSLRSATSDPSCTLCASTRVGRLFVKEGLCYWRCRTCRLVFAHGGPNSNLENRLEDFEPAYLDYLGATAEDEQRFRSLQVWMERFTPLAGRRLLDVGAGSGKWVRYLRARSVDVHGLEPSQALYERFLRAEPCFTRGFLEDFAARYAESFDLVTAFDVLEHVDRPRAFLRALACALKPGGALFVSTPDAASYLARCTGRFWHYYNRYHLSLFEAHTLRAALAELGLEELGFARLGRKKSLAYLWSYARDFVFRAGGPSACVPRLLEGLALPVNLFDTMDLCVRKATLPGRTPQ
jgi:2-polyprenyl-3-methyl-5-hydroxy-6-metoxy-1,4-benzoquinol methylase